MELILIIFRKFLRNKLNALALIKREFCHSPNSILKNLNIKLFFKYKGVGGDVLFDEGGGGSPVCIKCLIFHISFMSGK